MTLSLNLTSIPCWEYMTAAERWAALPPAYRDFMTTKPSTPEHDQYMAFARKLYPNLPPGAQQAALYCREIDGVKAAAKYATNARARWAVKGFKFVMPKRSNAGICTHSIKERDERLVRYRAHMAEGAKKLERQRKASQRKFDREIKAATAKNFPKFKAALEIVREPRVTRDQALPYVSFGVDDALSERAPADAPANARLVGWQCGFEPLFVAVWSYLPDVKLDDEEATEIATGLLMEKNWFSFSDGQRQEPDYVI